MGKLRQWFLGLRKRLIAWLLQRAFSLMVKVAVEEINQWPWRAWGESVNALTDKKVGSERSDPIQQALAAGVTEFARGIAA